jgi:hypothetical protein
MELGYFLDNRKLFFKSKRALAYDEVFQGGVRGEGSHAARYKILYIPETYRKYYISKVYKNIQ